MPNLRVKESPAGLNNRQAVPIPAFSNPRFLKPIIPTESNEPGEQFQNNNFVGFIGERHRSCY